MSANRRWNENEKKAFADIISGLEKEELLFVYEETRKKLKLLIEKDSETRYKFCDRCNRTSPISATKCTNCGGELREFEIPFDNYSL